MSNTFRCENNHYVDPADRESIMAGLKIAYVAYYDLGIQTAAREHIIQVVQEFARRGNRVSLYVKSADGAQFDGSVEMIEIPTGLSLFFDKKCARALSRGEKPDILYVRDFINAHRVIEWAHRNRIPIVLEHNGLYFAEMKSLPMKSRIMFRLDSLFGRFGERVRKADLNIVVAPAIGKFLAERFGIPGEKFVHIPNGVDTEKFAPAVNKAQLRRKLGLPPEAVIIGYIGSMYPWHHLGELIKGFEAVAEKRRDLFLLLGGGGLMLPRIEKLAAQSIVRDRIKIISPLPVDRSPDYIAALDIGVALMSPEVAPYCWQVKVNHYAASGVVSVMTYAQDFEELFASGVAVGVREPAPNQIARALENLLSDSKYAQMGKSAREFAVKNLSWSKIVDRIIAQIQKIGRQRWGN